MTQTIEQLQTRVAELEAENARLHERVSGFSGGQSVVQISKQLNERMTEMETQQPLCGCAIAPCNHDIEWKEQMRDNYIKLMLADDAEEGVIGILLNKNGACSLTVCPECGCDDFSHLESCSIWVEWKGG